MGGGGGGGGGGAVVVVDGMGDVGQSGANRTVDAAAG